MLNEFFFFYFNLLRDKIRADRHSETKMPSSRHPPPDHVVFVVENVHRFFSKLLNLCRFQFGDEERYS